jgi:hypothetical protein
MHGGPGRSRGEGMPDPVVVNGPPAPAEFAQVVGLPEDKVSGYAEVYQRFMDQTKLQRDSLEVLRRGMRDAFDAGDRDAAQHQRSQFRPLMDELSQRQSAFDDTLKGMLDKDQWKKYQGWRNDVKPASRRLHPRPRRPRLPFDPFDDPVKDPMTRSPLALFLVVTLLLPGEVHVLTGGCLPGLHAAAMERMQAAEQTSPGTDCSSHHPGQGPVRGGMQHCSVPSTCVAGPALLESSQPVPATQVHAATPALFLTTPHSLVTPPGTPPPRR